MGADSLAENTPYAPEFISPICLPKPKSSGFQWKKVSVIRGLIVLNLSGWVAQQNNEQICECLEENKKSSLLLKVSFETP